MRKKDTDAEIVADQSADRGHVDRLNVRLDAYKEEQDPSPFFDGYGEEETRETRGGEYRKGRRKQDERANVPRPVNDRVAFISEKRTNENRAHSWTDDHRLEKRVAG